MLRAHLFHSRGFSFLLVAILVVLTIGLCPSTSVAQVDVAFDADNPIASLQEANPTSDEERVELATQLMDARADTKISHAAYRKGVHYFRENHPTFYGNFFGDPYYASYDVRYYKLARERQIVDYEVNPQNQVFASTSFLCQPSTYDPAFGGVCFGYAFQGDDFFVLPSFMSPVQPDQANTLTADVERRGPPQRIVRTNRREAECRVDEGAKAMNRCEGSGSDEEVPDAPTDLSETDVRSIVEANADRLSPVRPAEREERLDLSNVDDVAVSSARELAPVHTNRRDDIENDDSHEDRRLAAEEIRRRLERATSRPSHDFDTRNFDLDRADRRIRSNRRSFDSDVDIDRPGRTSRSDFDRSGSSDFDRSNRNVRSSRSRSDSQDRSEPNIRRRGELDPNR